MGLDFDAVEYCKNVKLKQSNPPFACPVSKCDRSYKTVVGLQYHLLNYDHDNPQPTTPVLTPNRKKARSRAHSTPKTPKDNQATPQQKTNAVNPETLVTYNDEDKTVQFNIEGKSVRLSVEQPLPIITDEEFAELMERGLILKTEELPENAFTANVQVPVASYRIIEDYNISDAPVRPLAYYRFIEKSAEELDGEVEYDVDEEDTIWLSIMNEKREEAGLNPVSIDTLELLIDRLEKESYFQAAANGTSTGAEVDDDAVCCICMDGECQNTNVILFCDMCNLAVHQDCYGVPYIPEGQWLCRRCLQSPSTPVNCVLCPNAGGAFKQTDRGMWAHVVCALWIPEVRFANTVFLEPIDSIETIPQARWRLTCYVCREKGVGACIQCHRNSCYAAFHVTCAQQAGLYMTMDTVNEGHNDSSVHVQKYAYCHAHTPADAKLKANEKFVEDTRQKMREARKALAKKRQSAPVVLIPTIPPDRIQEISSLVTMQKKSQFLERLIAYWTLKRQHRNGVPLLRRLQSQGNHHAPLTSRNGIEGAKDTSELYQQLKYWQCLRQDLERARLLCELVRKREKLKAAYVKICEQVVMLQLNPLDSAMRKLLDALEAKDTSEIFREPVNTEEVPDYLDIVKHPMDLSTMREKLQRAEYSTLEQMEADFDLMIQNCLAYNNKDTVFYRAGIRMRDQAGPLFKQLRQDLEREGLVDHSEMQLQDHVEQEVENELKQLMEARPCEDIVQKMLILADKSQVLKNPSYRTKKIKQIRLEITRMRKAIQRAKAAARSSVMQINPQSDDDEDADEDMETEEHESTNRTLKSSSKSQMEDEDEAMGACGGADIEDESKEDNNTVQTPPCSPIKNLNNSASPAGVNRRTAVLFTRKAQAALKRPSEQPVKEESSSTSSAAAAAASLTSTSSSNSSSLTLGGGGGGGGSSTTKHAHLSPLSSSVGAVLSALSGATTSASLVTKSPKRNSRHKRISEMRRSASMSPKKSPHAARCDSMPSTSAAAAAAAAAEAITYNSIPDSFRVYRANTTRDGSESDDDDLSDISGSPCSSCSGFSVSGSGTEYDSSDDDDDDDEDDEDDDDDDTDEDDDDEDEDDEDADAVEGKGNAMKTVGGTAIAEPENEDVEMRDMTAAITNTATAVKVSAVTATGNGETAMSGCDSEEDEDDEENGDDANTNTNNTASSTARTPTPSEAKISTKKAALIKQHITKANATSTPAISAATIVASSGLSSAAVMAATPKSTLKAATRSASKHLFAGGGATVNNSKTKNNITTNDKILNNIDRTHNTRTNSILNNVESASSLPKPPLEPLQLVWAKCRGYPWYPALILDPKTPKGFVYNGVPLPAPPADVLGLRKNYQEDVFLVLFFDAKRTWQWLPANKLEILGIDKDLDQNKLVESRKPTDRKAVKKAYQDALHYQSQVSDLEGQGPDPIM